MTIKTAFTRMGGPPWPPVSDMSIPVVAIYRGKHRGLGEARGPVPTDSLRLVPFAESRIQDFFNNTLA